MRRKGLFAEIEGGGKALPSFLFSFSSLENEIFFSIIFLRTFFFFIVVILNRKRSFFFFRRTFFERKVSIFETFRNDRTIQFSMDVRGKLGYSCETLA